MLDPLGETGRTDAWCEVACDDADAWLWLEIEEADEGRRWGSDSSGRGNRGVTKGLAEVTGVGWATAGLTCRTWLREDEAA